MAVSISGNTISFGSGVVLNVGSETISGNTKLTAVGLYKNGIASYNQGRVAGFFSGGYTPSSLILSPPEAEKEGIGTFPFSNIINSATDAGELSTGSAGGAGTSSSTHGYVSGGGRIGDTFTGEIQKFQFSSSVSTSDIGELNTAVTSAAGVTSATDGYTLGGTGSGATPANAGSNDWQKMPFASDTTIAVAHTSPSFSRNRQAGWSSTTHGYVGGGTPNSSRNDFSSPVPASTNIFKFPFASETTTTTISTGTPGTTGIDSFNGGDAGYILGGIGAPAFSQDLVKYPFADENDETILLQHVANGGSKGTVNSQEAGFLVYNAIDRMSFNVEEILLDVSDGNPHGLVPIVGQYYKAGNQY